MHRGLTSTAAVTAAIAGTSLLTAATGGWRIAAGVLALTAAVLSTLDTTLKAAQSAEDHKRGFDGFTRMRTRFVQFGFVTVKLDQTPQQLAETFQGLVNERDQLSERVPAPPQWSIKTVKRRMEREREARLTLSAGQSPQPWLDEEPVLRGYNPYRGDERA